MSVLDQELYFCAVLLMSVLDQELDFLCYSATAILAQKFKVWLELDFVVIDEDLNFCAILPPQFKHKNSKIV